MPLRTTCMTSACLLLWLAASVVSAHELPDNRATLVLRDNTHLTVTLYVSYPEVLSRALAPGKPFEGFLLEYSTMGPATFRRELVSAQSQFERATRVYMEDGRQLALGNWRWPSPEAVQGMLRKRVMQGTVGGDADSHDEPAEIRAEASAQRDIRSVSIEFPGALQQVLVIAYRPTQKWVAAGTRSAKIVF